VARPAAEPSLTAPRRHAGHVRNLLVPLALALASIPVAQPALAYVDPAASSLILQVILGGIAGAGVLLRIFWRRIRRAVKGDEAAPAAEEKPGPGPSR